MPGSRARAATFPVEKFAATETDSEVGPLAWLNSHFQTGLRNLLDRAILEHEHFHGLVPHEGYAKVDEIPFDFSRRLMSVVVSTPDGGRRLICKGAIESVFAKS